MKRVLLLAVIALLYACIPQQQPQRYKESNIRPMTPEEIAALNNSGGSLSGGSQPNWVELSCCAFWLPSNVGNGSHDEPNSIDVGSDLDCDDFGGSSFRVGSNDPGNLDGDGDGIACE